ncbi:hypothetical protein F2P81_012351 [Scophthalmus maximus]|uniref:Uncharacterized protein n=1 Tax=Scophthalmus maximus TaxID=52904 RepID=A0A6A4SKB3_SCOMX|nr:hypothetical protein F2P81_012351 [Scophthalmus maximus]
MALDVNKLAFDTISSKSGSCPVEHEGDSSKNGEASRISAGQRPRNPTETNNIEERKQQNVSRVTARSSSSS